MKRRLAQRVLATELYAALIWAANRILDRVWRGRSGRDSDRTSVVILAANGGGNIGDQALLEAALDASQGAVVVLAKSRAHVTIPDDVAPRVRVVEVPHLLDPLIVRGLRDQRVLREHVSGADEFWIVGADLMDGLYNPAASVSRASMLVSAHALGSRARALGFSWPDAPVRSVASRLRKADAVAKLFARDPVSFERMKSQGFARVSLASDIVFSNTRTKAPAEFEAQVSEWEGQGRPFAIVNVSALIGSRMDQAAEYHAIVATLRELGYAIVGLPHVIRASGDDLKEMRKVFSDATASRPDVMVERLLEPAESRWLASRASLVVTGRMHLAVLALGAGTPAVTLGTQGKVEGLYQFFGVPEYAVTPGRGFGDVVSQRLRAIHADYSATREGIRAHVDEVVELSSGNFASAGL